MSKIVSGNTARFAIESAITKAYERLSFLALGYFVIFINGRRFGVYAPTATLLACSFGQVESRIANRSRHKAPFASNPDAGAIADAYRDALYAPDKEEESYFGIPHEDFAELVRSNHLVWAPDGDQAFDDWSHVLHFDVEDRVRLIAFKSKESGYHHDPGTITDMWMEAVEFYRILEQWRDAFRDAWMIADKVPEADDGGDPRGSK